MAASGTSSGQLELPNVLFIDRKLTLIRPMR
jgi:hypothetical protein